MATTGSPKVWYAAGWTEFFTQRLRDAVIGQLMVAAGATATRPSSSPETLSGVSMPQDLPPTLPADRTKAEARTSPLATQAASASARHSARGSAYRLTAQPITSPATPKQAAKYATRTPMPPKMPGGREQSFNGEGVAGEAVAPRRERKTRRAAPYREAALPLSTAAA